MTDCDRLSQRMPAVARGILRWTAEEEAHLAACADCGAEWNLTRTARALGREVEAGLDPSPIAELVVARLRAAPAADRVRRWRRVAWGGAALAAAASLALFLLPPGDRATPGDAPTPTFLIQLPELEELSAAELQNVLEAIEPAVQGTPIIEPGLGDLNVQELERVLGSLEG